MTFKFEGRAKEECEDTKVEPLTAVRNTDCNQNAVYTSTVWKSLLEKKTNDMWPVWATATRCWSTSRQMVLFLNMKFAST